MSTVLARIDVAPGGRLSDMQMRFVSVGLQLCCALVRVALVMVVVVAAAPVFAEDARVSFLTRQIKAAKDARVKAQTVLLLGQTKSEDAAPALCDALKDPDVIVRSAAASAVAESRVPVAVECLRTMLGERDPAVRAAMQKALDSIRDGQAAAGPDVAAGSLYVSIEPIADKTGGMEGVLALADKILRERLTAIGASFAPEGEDKKSAAARIKAKGLKAYQLRLQLLPGATEKGLKVEMLIMTYPEQSLQGTWNVKASGGKPEALIKAMVPRVVDDAAGDLNWKN